MQADVKACFASKVFEIDQKKMERAAVISQDEKKWKKMSVG